MASRKAGRTIGTSLEFGLKHIAIVILVLGTMAGCQDGAPRADAALAADGKSLAHAVILTGKNEYVNIEAEHVWLREHEPEGKLTGQGLIAHGGRFYDQMDIVRPDGTKQSYFFDITNGFGKL